MINRSFWRNKKVFITGNTGFKGSWLHYWLNLLGAKVLGYALPPLTNPNMFHVLNLEKNNETFFEDLRNIETLKYKLQQFQPEIIIHMAAQSLVIKGYKNPLETFSSNIMGTINLLENSRNLNELKAILIVTSDKCYENKEFNRGYHENDQIGGKDPYSCSKGCVELVANCYKNSFFNESEIAIATARSGNVIGGGDWSQDRLFPDIINSFSKNIAVQIRNPNSIRPWQHVLEPISGYLILIEKMFENKKKFSESWNFGPYEDNEKTVTYVVNKLVELWDNKQTWFTKDTQNYVETKVLKLDISKSVENLNWTPKMPFIEALKKTVLWYKEKLHNGNMRKFTKNQINEYMEL